MRFPLLLLVVLVFLLVPLAVVVTGITIAGRSGSWAPRLMGAVLIVAGVIALGTMVLAMADQVRDPFPFLFLVLLWSAAGIIFIFWVWMLADCALNEPRDSLDKLTWVIIIIVTNVVGAAIYFLGRRPRRLAEESAEPGV